jgi:serine protease Do
MRRILAILLLVPAAASGQDKADLARFERQLKAAHANVGPSLACVVVSRSEKYPKLEQPAEPWQLGRFDRDAFLKADPKRKLIVDELDLANPEAVPDHGFSGGAVVDAAGHVLVNYHAIEGATKIYVHLGGGGGSYADIRAADSRSDLAVLKLLDPPAGLKPIRFGTVRLPAFDKDPKATVANGSVCLLMALPFTSGALLDKPKAGLATITQVHRRSAKGEAASLFSSIYNYAPTLVYESKFQPGASGAVLVNLDGEAVGFTTTTAALPADEAGHGHALPLDGNVTRIIDVLRRGEEVEYGFLGVTRTFQQFNVPGRGIPIENHIGPSTPAALAKLRPGDVILKINDTPVSTFEDLLLHVGHGLAGRTISMTVQSGVESREVDVTLAKFKNEVPYIASVRPEPVHGLRVEYGSVLLQMQFNPFFGGGARAFTRVPNGVLAREPLPDSPAARKFKDLGDARWVVTHVNGAAVSTPAEFYKEAARRKAVVLTVVDANDPGSPREVTLP